MYGPNLKVSWAVEDRQLMLHQCCMSSSMFWESIAGQDTHKINSLLIIIIFCREAFYLKTEIKINAKKVYI